jgi:hypothetical protein
MLLMGLTPVRSTLLLAVASVRSFPSPLIATAFAADPHAFATRGVFSPPIGMSEGVSP